MEEKVMVMKVDPFFTDPRITICFATTCINNVNKKCRFSELKLNDQGQCKSYYVRKIKSDH